MDDAVAMDEFQEADILWPDTEDELVVPFAPVGSVSGAAAPVLGSHFEGLFLLATGARPSLSASSSGACADPDDDGEEWQEADVLWPDTAGEPRGGLGSFWPFPGCAPGSAGRHLMMNPAAGARRDGWRTGPAASTPIDIPGNVAARRRF